MAARGSNTTCFKCWSKEPLTYNSISSEKLHQKWRWNKDILSEGKLKASTASRPALKEYTRDKEGYWILMKYSNQEDIIILNVYAPSNIVSKFLKLTLTEVKGEIGIGICRIIVEVFNKLLSVIDLGNKNS